MFDLNSAFEFQAKLQSVMNDANLPDNRDDLLSQYALGIYTELGEALAINKNWKPWRKNEAYNTRDYIKEIADIWIFLINFSLASGMTAQDVLTEIDRKQQILIDRLENNEIH